MEDALRDLPDHLLLDRIMSLNLDPADELELIERYEARIGNDSVLRKIELLYATGDHVRAVELAKQEESAEAQYFLGTVTGDGQYFEQALDTLIGKRRDDPLLGRVVDGLADLYFGSGSIHEFVSLHKRVANIGENPIYFERLALGNILLGKLDRGQKYLEMFEELISTPSQKARYSVLLALIHSIRGDSTTALTVLEKYANLRMNDTDPFSNTLYYLVLARLFGMDEVPSYEIDENLCIARALSISRDNVVGTYLSVLTEIELGGEKEGEIDDLLSLYPGLSVIKWSAGASP